MLTSRRLAGLLVVCLACLLGRAPAAQEREDGRTDAARVFVHPATLTAEDILTDGSRGRPIAIESATTLIWVDLMPGARFDHDTEYVLISAEGTRVIRGQRRPVLNGRGLFDGATEPYRVDFPLALPGR